MKRVLPAVALAIAVAFAASSRAQSANSTTCGPLRASATQSASTYRWTISGPTGSTTESGTLKGGPRFECIDGAVLIVKFTSTAGHSLFSAYFPDGTDISYGRQQIARNGSRYVLPIQARARIAAALRGAFDYHCRLDMPADPLPPNARTECLF